MSASGIICPKPSPLMISTMTVMTKIMEKPEEIAEDIEFIIDLETFSRFVPIYEQKHEVIESKMGGAVGLRHSSITPRGAVIKKKN